MTNVQLLELAEKKNYQILLYQIEKILNSSTKQKLISTFINNKLYFFFKINNRIFCVSEKFVAVVAAGLGLTLVVGIKKIFYRYKIGKKIKIQLKRAIAKSRGGGFESLQKETVEIDDGDLSFEELLVKSIIQKCLKPDKIYRIVNLEIVQKIHGLIKFGPKEATRLVTYEVFVHVLIIYVRRWLKVGHFVAIGDLRESSIAAAALVYSPIVGSAIFAMCLGLIVSPQITIVPFIVALSGTMGLTLKFSYPFFSFLRELWFIKCDDYVKEIFYHKSSNQKSKQSALPSTDNKSPLTEPQCDTSSNFMYTRDRPIKEDIYVETSPNVPFCQELDSSTFKIDTLDGSVQNHKHADGSTRFGWLRDMKKRFKSTEPENSGPYIPLKKRTRTLSDCTLSDTTQNLQATKRVIEAVEIEAGAKSAIPKAIRKDALFDAGLEL